MDEIQARLFTELERTTHYAFLDPSPEAHELANAAMRRYRAYVERDYKTLWQQTELVLQHTRAVLDLVRKEHAELDAKIKLERSKILATIEDIQRVIEHPRVYTGC